jgi:hypothetical protein
MLRSFAALAILAGVSVPAAAATYSATVSTSAPSRIPARDLLWSCGSGVCTGATANSRPVVLCQGLAKKAGRIESFTVDGRPIALAELDSCNASAKPDRNTAVATIR